MKCERTQSNSPVDSPSSSSSSRRDRRVFDLDFDLDFDRDFDLFDLDLDLDRDLDLARLDLDFERRLVLRERERDLAPRLDDLDLDLAFDLRLAAAEVDRRRCPVDDRRADVERARLRELAARLGRARDDDERPLALVLRVGHLVGTHRPPWLVPRARDVDLPAAPAVLRLLDAEAAPVLVPARFLVFVELLFDLERPDAAAAADLQAFVVFAVLDDLARPADSGAAAAAFLVVVVAVVVVLREERLRDGAPPDFLEALLALRARPPRGAEERRAIVRAGNTTNR